MLHIKTSFVWSIKVLKNGVYLPECLLLHSNCFLQQKKASQYVYNKVSQPKTDAVD